MSQHNDDDLLIIEDNDTVSTSRNDAPCWRILVVDDDKDVHEATDFALAGIEILGRRLKLFHAYSGREAINILDNEPDIAVALLDVVMESDDAGLKTVEAIRNELMLLNIRIILRTGQPGQAPEADTITRYDINDYKTKSELTHARLFTTLTSAIRSYSQLQRLDASRRGLEKIVAASNQFIAEQGMHAFAEGVITQLAGLIGIAAEGLVCAAEEGQRQPGEFRVIAAAGRYGHLIQHRVSDIDNLHIARALNTALRNRCGMIGSQDITLYFRKQDNEGFAAYIESATPIRDIDQHLLEIFCTNIALCAKNIDLVAALRQDALIDRQVGLPNRNALIAELGRRIGEPEGGDDVVALIDIDQFAATNDMLGHQYGDALLLATAQRLRTLFHPSIYVARLAGDAFALAGPSAQVSAARIQHLFEHPFLIEDNDHAITVCIGVAPLDGCRDGQDALKNAYVALRRAKATGIGQSIVFTPDIGLAARERTGLLRDLRQAFERRQLHIVFQPQIDLRSGQVIGAEALLRWRREDGSYVPPDRFVPIAEQSGLIVAIGRWMLPEALAALQRFRQSGFPELRMAVNISTVQLRQPGFFDFVNDALRDSGADARHLELEITESIALESLEPMIQLLNRLRGEGVRIAIDDFGTGYSSLNYLEQLPIDHLKIDRSFVLSLSASDRGARIVRTIAMLGQELDMRTVAEGVENEKTGEHLRDIGCDAAQGYHYAEPMEEATFLAWLRDNA